MALGKDAVAEILIATTWECNLRCAYCFVRRNEILSPVDRMSPELAERAVDSLDKGLSHVETICLHLYGGEPLTNIPALEAMVRRAAAKKAGRFRFAITTNGTIVDSRAFELLDKGKFQVIISIDGPEQIHNACRVTASGKATHGKVMAFLDGIRNRTACWVRGSAVVRSGWGLKEANEYLLSLPVDAVKAQAVRLKPGSKHGLTESEKSVYLRDLEVIGKQVIDELEAGRQPRDDRFSSRVLQLLTGKKRKAFCGAGRTTFGITPEGRVLPCILIRDQGSVFGHIDDDPKIWLSNAKKRTSRRHVGGTCEECDALPLCGGGCQAVIPVCGEDECDIVRKNCEIARMIYRRFEKQPMPLLLLAGIK